MNVIHNQFLNLQSQKWTIRTYIHNLNNYSQSIKPPMPPLFLPISFYLNFFFFTERKQMLYRTYATHIRSRYLKFIYLTHISKLILIINNQCNNAFFGGVDTNCKYNPIRISIIPFSFSYNL